MCLLSFINALWVSTTSDAPWHGSSVDTLTETLIYLATAVYHRPHHILYCSRSVCGSLLVRGLSGQRWWSLHSSPDMGMQVQALADWDWSVSYTINELLLFQGSSTCKWCVVSLLTRAVFKCIFISWNIFFFEPQVFCVVHKKQLAQHDWYW